MEIVKQKHNMGCGIACVASVVEDSYDNVLKRCKSPQNAFEIGFYMPELKRLLKLYGKGNYSFRKYSLCYNKYLQKNGTIIFIKKSKIYPCGHYLNKIDEGWMNPWINCPIISPLRAGIDTSIKESMVDYILFENDQIL